MDSTEFIIQQLSPYSLAAPDLRNGSDNDGADSASNVLDFVQWSARIREGRD